VVVSGTVSAWADLVLVVMMGFQIFSQLSKLFVRHYARCLSRSSLFLCINMQDWCWVRHPQ
jgi:hypothetical protein